MKITDTKYAVARISDHVRSPGRIRHMCSAPQGLRKQRLRLNETYISVRKAVLYYGFKSYYKYIPGYKCTDPISVRNIPRRYRKLMRNSTKIIPLSRKVL